MKHEECCREEEVKKKREKFKSGIASQLHTAGQSQQDEGVGVMEVTDMAGRRGPR